MEFIFNLQNQHIQYRCFTIKKFTYIIAVDSFVHTPHVKTRKELHFEKSNYSKRSSPISDRT